MAARGFAPAAASSPVDAIMLMMCDTTRDDVAAALTTAWPGTSNTKVWNSLNVVRVFAHLCELYGVRDKRLVNVGETLIYNTIKALGIAEQFDLGGMAARYRKFSLSTMAQVDQTCFDIQTYLAANIDERYAKHLSQTRIRATAAAVDKRIAREIIDDLDSRYADACQVSAGVVVVLHAIAKLCVEAGIANVHLCRTHAAIIAAAARAINAQSPGLVPPRVLQSIPGMTSFTGNKEACNEILHYATESDDEPDADPPVATAPRTAFGKIPLPPVAAASRAVVEAPASIQAIVRSICPVPGSDKYEKLMDESWPGASHAMTWGMLSVVRVLAQLFRLYGARSNIMVDACARMIARAIEPHGIAQQFGLIMGPKWRPNYPIDTMEQIDAKCLDIQTQYLAQYIDKQYTALLPLTVMGRETRSNPSFMREVSDMIESRIITTAFSATVATKTIVALHILAKLCIATGVVSDALLSVCGGVMALYMRDINARFPKTVPGRMFGVAAGMRSFTQMSELCGEILYLTARPEDVAPRDF
jgi:hypothetical protein